MISINLKNISKNFKDLTVLKEVNFEIENREIISIIGPSGCGKTTLLKIINGLITPTNGKIEINGIDSLNLKENKIIGNIFQNPVLLPWRTVYENVALPLEILNKENKDKIKNKVLKIVEVVGLKEYIDFYPNQLSGGMMQRVAIARALVFNPKILLMDEPFSALDEITREKMNELILDIWKKKLVENIILVTHSIEDAIYLSDRIFILKNNKIKDKIKIEVKDKHSKKFKELKECLKLKLL